MYDNINAVGTESSEKGHPYEFKEEPIQLLYVSDGLLHQQQMQQIY